MWGEGPLGSGFGANVFNYVFKSEVPKMVFFDGLGPVLRSGFEHSHLITCLKQGLKPDAF